jgi:protein ImuB
VRRLLTDLEHWLVARQLGAEQLRWHFGAGGEWVCMPVRFARARQRLDAFLDITRLELEATGLPEGVIDLRLEAHRLVPWATGSHGLFTTLPNGHDLEDVSGLVDQLRARLGHGACYSLASTDQHTPEQAWQQVSPFARHQASAPPTRRRPLWLFDPPRAVTAQALTLLRGPERIHTGWWSGSGQARDYYVARHRNGAECWVFVDPAERWFLHGYFA